MKEAKQIAYWYDGVLAENETELDLNGAVIVPLKGDTRRHDGKMWQVEFVKADRSSDGPLPIYCVYFKEVEN